MQQELWRERMLDYDFTGTTSSIHTLYTPEVVVLKYTHNRNLPRCEKVALHSFDDLPFAL